MVKKWIMNEFIRDNLGKYVLGLMALITASLLQLALPKLLGYITDSLYDRTHTIREIYWLSAVMLITALFLFGMKYTFRVFLIGKSRDLECFLRAKLFAHLQTLPPKFYNNKKTGDLMAYAINDLGAIRMAFAFGLVFLIEGILINVVSLVVMVKTIHPMLTLLAIGPIVVSIVIVWKLRKKIRKKFTVVQEAFADLSDKIQENISGIRVVKSYVQERQEIEKLHKASNQRLGVQMDYVKTSGLLMPAAQVCFGASFTLVLTVGSMYVVSGSISLGDFIAFNTYLGMLMGPVNNLGRIVEVWQKALASMNRLDEIFAEQTDIIDQGIKEKKDLKGSIRIKNLSFAYPGSTQNVLENIHITIPAGKTLGVIGRTGSGKTTMINLLLRLFQVERGQIFIDGMDINDIPLTTLRNQIGYVPQDNFLFSTTIKSNIKFFQEQYGDELVEEAAKISSVYDNIADFPDGFETMIGERGITLSGGQKQRISIARAVIKEPSVLILDDSLSAVDTKTEEQILSNIKRILKDRTGILIAHRISTIKHADEIIVMDRGRIVERGNHKELLEQKGEYYKLYQAQMTESSLETIEEMAI